MNRDKRLASGKNWIANFRGKSIVKAYSKKYKVDKFCAIKELRILGVEISKKYENDLRKSIEGEKKNLERKRKKSLEKRQIKNFENESDEYLAFIAGYTSNGVPFGITHEEIEKNDKNVSLSKTEKLNINKILFDDEN